FSHLPACPLALAMPLLAHQKCAQCIKNIHALVLGILGWLSVKIQEASGIANNCAQQSIQNQTTKLA
ncbi:MAG: hypothetical protein QM636_14030, partial [Rhizobium sp.]